MSHSGDPIEGRRDCTRVTKDGRVLMPPGATVSGRIQSVGRLGLGLKRARATMQLRLRHTSPAGWPKSAYPHASGGSRNRKGKGQRRRELSEESARQPVFRPPLPITLCQFFAWIPRFGLPVLAVKFLIARSPDSEIYFPTGTEFVIRAG